VALAYTIDSQWRNRPEFVTGREAIEAFLTRKCQRELDYRLIKELWVFRENRIAVRFAYAWHDDAGSWFRSYGNENWEFDEDTAQPASTTRRSRRLTASSSGCSDGGQTIIRR
jgi:nuclear transport factor 2 (NTF2) superfamily protein